MQRWIIAHATGGCQDMKFMGSDLGCWLAFMVAVLLVGTILLTRKR